MAKWDKSKHFDSIEAFYNATHNSLAALTDNLSELTEQRGEAALRAWKNSLPDFAALLHDPGDYIDRTVADLEDKAARIKAFQTMPEALKRVLNYADMANLREAMSGLRLDAAADSLLEQANRLRGNRGELGEARFPEDTQVEIEFPLKLSRTGARSKRIDVLLCRRPAGGREQYAVVELKQWTEDSIIVDPDSGEVRIGDSKNDSLPHPVDQALEYVSLLPNERVCGQPVAADAKIQAYVYLHNQLYERGRLFDAKLFPRVHWDADGFKMFSRGHCGRMILQLMRQLQ